MGIQMSDCYRTGFKGRFFFSLCFAVLVQSMASCSNEKTVGIYGLPPEVKPLADTSNEEKALAKAVGVVEFAYGGNATGFFISDDGLFLTNNHVIPRGMCTAERCAGIRIIRHMTPNGEMKIYNRFKVLIQNPTLDVALLSVSLGDGETTPFIPLSKETTFRADNVTEKSIRILGHPMDASIHVAKARVTDVGPFLSMKSSGLLEGFSGGPIVDLRTGQAIGLVHSAQIDSWSLEKDGTAGELLSRGTLAAEIIRVLTAAFLENGGVLELKAKSITALPARSTVIRDVFPMTNEEIEKETEPRFDRWIHLSLETPAEGKDFLKLQEHIQTRLKEEIVPTVNRTKILQAINRTWIRGGLDIDSRKTLISEFLTMFYNHSPISDPVTEGVRSSFGLKTQESCLAELTFSPEDFFISDLYLAVQKCRATNPKGIASMVETRRFLEKPFWSDKDAAGIGYLAFRLTMELSDLATPAELGAWREDAMAILTYAIKKSRRLAPALFAEGLFTRFQASDRVPKLLGYGRFRETFPVVSIESIPGTQPTLDSAEESVTPNGAPTKEMTKEIMIPAVKSESQPVAR